jgi:hypothetical protein
VPWGRNSGNSNGGDGPKASLWLRFQNAVVKPDESGSSTKEPDNRTIEELEAENLRANDKERAIGLIAAPLAALIGIVISGDQIDNAINHNQSTAIYHDLLWVLVLMSVLMLVTAMLRKRMFLGMVTALYGLAVFNLKYWGFGVPFVLVGAYFLVRSYRLSQALKIANGDGTGAQRRPGARPEGSLPRPNKRYTPPTAPAKRPAKPKPDNEQKAG